MMATSIPGPYTVSVIDALDVIEIIICQIDTDLQQQCHHKSGRGRQPREMLLGDCHCCAQHYRRKRGR
jgi:hypothetical protein